MTRIYTVKMRELDDLTLLIRVHRATIRVFLRSTRRISPRRHGSTEAHSTSRTTPQYKTTRGAFCCFFAAVFRTNPAPPCFQSSVVSSSSQSAFVRHFLRKVSHELHKSNRQLDLSCDTLLRRVASTPPISIQCQSRANSFHSNALLSFAASVANVDCRDSVAILLHRRSPVPAEAVLRAPVFRRSARPSSDGKSGSLRFPRAIIIRKPRQNLVLLIRPAARPGPTVERTRIDRQALNRMPRWLNRSGRDSTVCRAGTYASA